ncbi:helix-turn-helix transcriptional regulator [Streptomyces otsuchiensis]|uniref:helix-turn-helix transcriptional regulator n=1 Tax=Streptomyces otsuchiensis TaxID=2681388 RepID=UPI0010309E9D|nr:helix-turn-helix transcriptional regulator [Streptomyces otsuchiensis]
MTSAIGANIRRLREERGWSQSRLARETCKAARISGDPIGRQEISRYETGKRTPREWLPHIAAALGARTDDLTLEAQELITPKPSLADFLPEDDALARVRSARIRRIGLEEVQDITHRAHGLRLADDVVSGGDLIRPALRELRSAIRMYREGVYTEEIGNAFLAQVGELAQITGWIASDTGRQAEAERIYRLGISAARQAGDRTLTGNLAGSLAYQYSNTQREADGVALAAAAVQEAGSSARPKAQALYLDRLAWAYAKVGDAQLAARALGDASEALTAHDAEDDAPDYLYWMNPDELKVMESRCYTELRRPLRAVPLLRDVLSTYNATLTRELVLYLSWLVVALADANEPEEAALTAERAIQLSRCVASERATVRIDVILKRLAQYSDVPEVASLLANQRIPRR